MNASAYPPPLTPARPLPEFMTRYDFSRVPSIAPMTPYANTGPVACTEANANACNWGCPIGDQGHCLRPNDKTVCLNKNDWLITYDDGPSLYTELSLNWLKQRNLKAVYFVIGGNALEYPQVVQRAFDEGHEIGVHTWSHKALTTLTTEEVIGELEWTIKVIGEITGSRPKYFRPPFGDIDDRVRGIASAMNLTPVIWSFDSRDFNLNVDKNSIAPGVIETSAATFFKQDRSGGVISLQHDISEAAALRGPSMADALLAAGARLASIGDCLGVSSTSNELNNRTTTTTTTTTIGTEARIAPTVITTATQTPKSSSTKSIISNIMAYLVAGLTLAML